MCVGGGGYLPACVFRLRYEIDGLTKDYHPALTSRYEFAPPESARDGPNEDGSLAGYDGKPRRCEVRGLMGAWEGCLMGGWFGSGGLEGWWFGMDGPISQSIDRVDPVSIDQPHQPINPSTHPSIHPSHPHEPNCLVQVCMRAHRDPTSKDRWMGRRMMIYLSLSGFNRSIG